MTKTEKYQLNQWDPEDKVLREDFCEDNRKIDAAIRKAEDKADAAQGTADGACAALKTLAGQVTALEQGQLRYVYGEYTGDGTAGKNNPTRLDFDFKPLMLLIVHPSYQYYGGFPWLRGMRSGYSSLSQSGGTSYMYLTWEERAVQWYSYYSNASGGDQLNAEGTTYWYFALGVAE